MNRRSLSLLALMGYAALRGVGSAPAAEYRFTYGRGVTQLLGAAADNAATLASLTQLLRAYHATPALQFVLVGAVPANCPDSEDCPARALLQRRVETLMTQLAAQPGGVTVVGDLQWQGLAPDATTLATDALELRVRAPASAAWSQACPFELLINDPRLPAQLATSPEDPDWVAVSAAAAIPVGPVTALRVRLVPPPRQPVGVEVIQRLADQALPLGSGPMQAQWMATQLQWRADAAEVEISSALRSRDIGNLILPGEDAAPAAPPASEPSGSCHVHLVRTAAPAGSRQP
jgi:hypothetical protein